MTERTKKPFRILSIDGGGIRGIIPAMVIKAIEDETGKPMHELFDMIVGTSTGGIIALGLTLPLKDNKPYDADFLIDLYSKRGGEIFHQTTISKLFSLGGILEEKYSQGGIEAILKEYFQSVKLSQVLPGVEVMVTAYETERRQPWFFKSHVAKIDALRDNYAWEAARSTSAAPTYFEPYKLKLNENDHLSLVDGGVFANNPTLCAYAEAKVILGKRNAQQSRTTEETGERGLESLIVEARDDDNKNFLVVSVGTGSATLPYMHEEAKKWGAAGWLSPLISILMQGVSESVDYQMRQLLPESTDGERHYYRFQVELKPENEQMDDVSENNVRGLRLQGENLVRNSASDIINLCKQLKKYSEL
ncbi:MAG: patatin-like phospholipase family protein [Bacteroidia bacterium]|nr:patatin-like phospholipase family protein [Bacteroidia bacterium]